MKKFLILYIILIILSCGYFYYRYHGYCFGLANETGKIVVPIKYNYVLALHSEYDSIYFNKKVLTYFGVDGFGVDYYNDSGFMYRSKKAYNKQYGNLKQIGNNLYLNDKLISRNTYFVYSDKDIYPYTRVANIYKKGYNFVNLEDGTFLFPKYKEYQYKNNYFFAYNKDNTEVYDKTGKEVCKADLYVEDIYDNLLLGRPFKYESDPMKYNLYSKDGSRINDTEIKNYCVYNNKLYIITPNYEPLVYNKEKNIFETTDIHYTGSSSCVHVRQNGKYGFIIGDYKSPVIYDNIYYGREKACVVKLGDKVGVIGPDTNIPCDYKYIFSAENGLYVFTKEDSEFSYRMNYGVASLYNNPNENNQIINSTNPMPLRGLIDSKGKVIVPDKYVEFRFSDKYILAIRHKNTSTEKDKYIQPLDNNVSDIYDLKGNLIETKQGYFHEYNNYLITGSSYIPIDEVRPYPDRNDEKRDMTTLKTFRSFQDYLT